MSCWHSMSEKRKVTERLHSSAFDVVVQESADRGQGYHQGSRRICRKGHTGDSGHGQSKADHHGLLHGKVGGTDEKESD